MRLLRWKSGFRTGKATADRRNRSFIDCVNKLINAASRREHCREMEDFIDRFSSDADKALQQRTAERDLRREFGHHLLASLPLGSFGGNACRKCGLCDLDQDQVAEHLDAPKQCLFESVEP